MLQYVNFVNIVIFLYCIYIAVQFCGPYPRPTRPDRQAAGAGDGLQGDGARQGLHARQEEGKMTPSTASHATLSLVSVQFCGPNIGATWYDHQTVGVRDGLQDHGPGQGLYAR